MIEATTPTAEVSAPAGGVLALLRSGALVSVGLGATYVLNGLFNLVMVHALEPREYSLMAALFTVVLMSNVPTLALQAGVARGMAQQLRDAGEAAAGVVLRRALVGVARWQALLLVVAGALAVPLARLFHVHHPVPAAATAVAIAAGVVVPIAQGGMQARERFGEFALVQFLYAALKFPACLGLLAVGLGVSGVMGGIAVATAITAVVALWLQRDLLRAPKAAVHVASTALLRDSGVAAASLTLWTVAANADLVVARLVLPAHRAGLYAAASTAAKLVFVAPSIAMTVLFPRIARLSDSLREREHLVLGLRFVTLFATVGTAVAFVAPGPVIDLTLGAKYHGAAPWLGWICLAMSLFALAQVYVVHFVALGHGRFPLVLASGVVAKLVLFVALHASVHELLVAQLLAGGALVVCAELYDRLRGS